MVQPTMRQLKLGTLLRRENDKRLYSSVFRHRMARDWINWATAKTLTQVTEDVAMQNIDHYSRLCIRYEGLGRYFTDISGDREIVADWIKSHAHLGSTLDEYDIAIHVRLGDFTKVQDKTLNYSVRTPFEWYREALEKARQLIGDANPRIYLFTDDNPELVKTKLQIPKIRIDPSRNAAAAIWNLSKAQCIVTSRSSFSMWGVYLGDSHAVWHRDFDWQPSFPMRVDQDHII